MHYSCENGNVLIIRLDDEETKLLMSVSPEIGQILNNENPTCPPKLYDDTAALLLFIIADAEKSIKSGVLSPPPVPLLINIEAKLHQGKAVTVISVRRCGNTDTAHRSFDIPAAKKRKIIKLKTNCLIYRFDSFFDAYDCISALKYHNFAIDKCRLYKLGESYCVTLSASREICRKLAYIMSDFGKKCSKKTAVFLGERGAVLYDDFYNIGY